VLCLIKENQSIKDSGCLSSVISGEELGKEKNSKRSSVRMRNYLLHVIMKEIINFRYINLFNLLTIYNSS